MERTLVIMLALASLCAAESFADGTFAESIRFVQYLDENTALEEVRNGNLDMYFYRVAADRLENAADREGLRVFDSTGGSYSLLVNPAESERTNPFSSRESRFALNYLVDRKLIVNELMGGYGSPIASYYGPSDPEYLTVIEELESFNFRYNPALAKSIISEEMTRMGARMSEGLWMSGGEPVEVAIFIRSDDPVRKSIGEILASELEDMGFVVKRDYGDLNKAFVVVYGSDPADLKWNIYTEGWGRSAFVRYDAVGLSQMYGPWFSNMPGFNDPSYWNYENPRIDELTQRIYGGDFDSAEQRAGLVREAVTEGVGESVRIFVASVTDQYVVNRDVTGVVNDFGAGVPGRFTPINAQGSSDELAIGVKQIYQGAWNPVMGLTDTYSRQIWNVVSDPGTFKHPFSGETIPVRAGWAVETAGPGQGLDVDPGAVMWDAGSQEWRAVGPDAHATSKVTFDLEFSRWHNGRQMDMNDIMHSLYFAAEWGTQSGGDDKTFDAEFTPRAAQSIQTIVGVNPVDEDTIEVYVDYWHFDDGEIASWAEMWSTVPWEVTAAMEKAVTDGKASFSRSGATSRGVSWLSLLVPDDAQIIRESLAGFAESGFVPPALGGMEPGYYRDRYEASAAWIGQRDHAVISNGPYHVESYSPESRTIRIVSFDDDSYPFEAGAWSGFESPQIPRITGVEMDRAVQRGQPFEIGIGSESADTVLLFLIDARGRVVATDSRDARAGWTTIGVPEEASGSLDIGANTVKIFAISESVLRPDYYESGFIALAHKDPLPEPDLAALTPRDAPDPARLWPALAGVAAAAALAVVIVRRVQSRARQSPPRRGRAWQSTPPAGSGSALGTYGPS